MPDGRWGREKRLGGCVSCEGNLTANRSSRYNLLRDYEPV